MKLKFPEISIVFIILFDKLYKIYKHIKYQNIEITQIIMAEKSDSAALHKQKDVVSEDRNWVLRINN